MKNILIIGANSYIGTCFRSYIQHESGYSVQSISVRDDAWKKQSFVGVDVIYHCAAIVHEPGSKNDPAQEARYHRVNAELPFEIAKKAKSEGVGQFIFLSSASVYGLDGTIGKPSVITRDTPTVPTDLYGKSKLAGENLLLTLADADFKVVILRPPMIYGAGCKGNYNALAAFARKLPVFPKSYNAHFMIYIDNLSEFVRLMMDREERGIFCPQNEPVASTDEVVRLIAEAYGKKLWILPGFLWALKLAGMAVPKIRKAFGSLYYAPELSHYSENYCTVSLAESILRTHS